MNNNIFLILILFLSSHYEVLAQVPQAAPFGFAGSAQIFGRRALPNFTPPCTNGETFRITKVAHDRYIINGSFSLVYPCSTPGSPVTRNGVAALDARGKVTDWNPNPQAGSIIKEVVYVNNTLYLAGDFSNIGGTTRNNLAAVSPITGLVTTWNPNVTGTTVDAMVYYNNHLYVGGTFTAVNGSPRTNFAEIPINSSSPTALTLNFTGGVVREFFISGTSLYIGGGFTSPKVRIGEFNLTSKTMTAWAPSGSSDIVAFAQYGTTLYLGGIGAMPGTPAHNYFAAISTITGARVWSPVISGGDRVYDLAIDGTTLYVAGNFSQLSGVGRTFFGSYDVLTQTLTSWNPGVTGGTNIRDFFVDGNRVIATGLFDYLSLPTRTNIMSVNKSSAVEQW